VLKPPPGEVYHAIEARRRTGYYVGERRDGAAYRVRIRRLHSLILQAFDAWCGDIGADVVAIMERLTLCGRSRTRGRVAGKMADDASRLRKLRLIF